MMARFVIAILFTLVLSARYAEVHAQTVTVTLFSPQPYQVFQRVNGQADILVTGRVVGVTVSDVQIRYRGGDWITVPVQNSFFEYTLEDQPQGQGTFEVLVSDKTFTSNYVGIGDVYVIAGQSNASGRARRLQAYAHPTLKASLFANSFQWAELKDPTDAPKNEPDSVSRDGAAKGSYWPLLATYIMADQNVPVAFIPAAVGSTQVELWRPDPYFPFDQDTIFGSMINKTRYAESGGIVAVLWHQGEGDSSHFTHSSQYADSLIAMADGINQYLGAPTIAALIQNSKQLHDRSDYMAARGVQEAIEISPHILPGPDFRDLQTDDGVHFLTDQSMQTLAERWWSALDEIVYTN